MASPSPESLDYMVETAVALVAQLHDVLDVIQKPPPSAVKNEPAPQAVPSSVPGIDALRLASDCAKLIRAQSTKVALLITNEPFSPRPVCSIISELIRGPVPALATACQRCTGPDYTLIARKELASRSKHVLARVSDLLGIVPLNGAAVSPERRDDAIIGKLWSACHDVSSLHEVGVAGYFAQRVSSWKAIVKDMGVELKEWGNEQPNGGDEDDDDDAGDDASHPQDESIQDIVDRLMDYPQPIALDDPLGIRPYLAVALQRIGLLVVFYDAVVKRRCPTMPALPPAVPSAARATTTRLDEASAILERLPDHLEEVVHGFYQQDRERVERLMDSCFVEAVCAAELFKLDWDNKEDDFTSWIINFQSRIKRNASDDGLPRMDELSI